MYGVLSAARAVQLLSVDCPDLTQPGLACLGKTESGPAEPVTWIFIIRTSTIDMKLIQYMAMELFDDSSLWNTCLAKNTIKDEDYDEVPSSVWLGQSTVHPFRHGSTSLEGLQHLLEGEALRTLRPSATDGTNSTCISNQMGKELESWFSEKQKNKLLEQTIFLSLPVPPGICI
ncbi:hypothetical protein GWK47_048320 [Chionoecetes opilio]|uniref:Uncharacterized protein n=1 Tax=Chionoecetes opilio TaxID=41210 RepID=A0A8J4Y5F6_CHIOP|nr:hypothetical protein GWK47_048320 [Chionoecetes opilio]